MSVPAAPAKRPGRGWYAVAAALAALAVVIGAALALWIIRAMIGYDVTPFQEGEQVTIVLQDRGETIWVTPDNIAATCRSADGDELPFGPGSADRMTITDGGRNWIRVGILSGTPGSEYTVICEGVGTTQMFGHAPNPQIGRYVVVGVTGGAIAAVSATAAFIITLLVAIKRNSKPRVA